MRRLSRLAGFAAVLGSAALFAADGPAPVLKPAAPPGGQLRVRVPLAEGKEKTLRLKARVADPRKKGETIDVTASLHTLGRTMVSQKMAKKWGYEITNDTVTFPEVILPGGQLSPKPTKGRDAELKVANLKADAVVVPGDTTDLVPGFGTDIVLALPDVVAVLGRQAEPRLYFTDKFLDLNAPPAAVKRPGTGGDPEPEPVSAAEPGLTLFAAPMTNRAGTVFAYCSVNGQETVKTPDGTVHPVNAGISSPTPGEPGLVVSAGTARGLGLNYDEAKPLVTLNELRFGATGGPGLKANRDIVMKNVPAVIDTTASHPYIWVGYVFVTKHFPDAVLTTTPDGVTRLHGRIDPTLLVDPKTRKKP